MPDENSDPQKINRAGVQDQQGTDLSKTLPRLSFKTGVAIYLSAGLLLFVLSRFQYLIFHTLVETVSIVLLVTVFLIGWNTRELVRSQFFVILAIGLFASGLVDLLHMLAYKGMHVLPYADVDTETSFWLIARTLAAFAFLFAVLSLGRKETCSAKAWLTGFLSLACLLVLLAWPLDLFPSSFVDGEGLTAFKVNYEYVLIGLLCISAFILIWKQHYLNPLLYKLLISSLVLGALAEFVLTLYADVYGFINFLGHYLKLSSVGLVYLALVEGTLRTPVTTLFREMTESYDELNMELEKRVAAEKKQEAVHSEAAILYRMSRLMHSTLNLDELSHLILSAATTPGVGGFERATLFTVNSRTGTLQGMLGVSRDMANLVLPQEDDDQAWEDLHLDDRHREAQRTSPYNQLVVKQRLSLDREDNALSEAYHTNRVVFVSARDTQPAGGDKLTRTLNLGPYGCAPLAGRNQILGILLVDNPVSQIAINPDRMRFLELFANQAGSALDNASLVKRLEMAHDNLQEVQEQLIHGEKMAVLGEMAAQVAHELRNPLVSIGGFAQRLSRQDLQDDKANEYADIIAREVRRMEELLNNILSFSKKQLVCLEKCSVSAILQEVVDLEFEHCQKLGINIISNFESVPDIVGDYRQLRQVFLNLVINARQAMKDGGTLVINAEKGSLRGNEAVVVEVEDTGGGISPEIMRNIFNPFYSTSVKGTGLGLSISHRIVAHHHGEIKVVNAKRGARFIVVLPVLQAGYLKTQKQ